MKSIKIKLIFLLAFHIFLSKAQNNRSENFFFIAFGDMPYFIPEDYAKFENVIKTINAENPAFSVSAGDFKSSTTPCTDESFKKIYNLYTQFDKPLIYTPGDNEWTDCTKNEAGLYNAEERLDALRRIFFSDSSGFGKEKLKLTSQSKMQGFEKFVENKSWDFGKISFVTAHIVGTNNNFISTSKNGNKEFYERENADIIWLVETFTNAKKKDQSAVVIIIHADMFSDQKSIQVASGFYNIKRKLQELVVDFGKPVLLINGDSHLLLVDKPFFKDEEKEKTLDNFTRLQVPGEANMQAVKIHVNMNSKAIFQFEELFVQQK